MVLGSLPTVSSAGRHRTTSRSPTRPAADGSRAPNCGQVVEDDADTVRRSACREDDRSRPVADSSDTLAATTRRTSAARPARDAHGQSGASCPAVERRSRCWKRRGRSCGAGSGALATGSCAHPRHGPGVPRQHHHDLLGDRVPVDEMRPGRSPGAGPSNIIGWATDQQAHVIGSASRAPGVRRRPCPRAGSTGRNRPAASATPRPEAATTPAAMPKRIVEPPSCTTKASELRPRSDPGRRPGEDHGDVGETQDATWPRAPVGLGQEQGCGCGQAVHVENAQLVRGQEDVGIRDRLRQQGASATTNPRGRACR